MLYLSGIDALVVYASSSAEHGEEVASDSSLVPASKVLEELPSLPVQKEVVVQQEKTLSFRPDLLKAKVNTLNLPSLFLFSSSHQKKA